MIPKTLLDIKDFLLKNKLKLSSPLKDGRLNSSFNEDEIIKIIKKEI